MSKPNTFENDLLKLIFTNNACGYVGDETGLQGSTGAGNLWVSLHVDDPGETGDQTTNETSYSNYTRVAVARTTTGWAVSTNTVSNNGLVQFPQCGNNGAILTHFGVGTNDSGAGKLLYSGALSSNLAVSQGIQPQFAAGDLDVTED